MSYYKYEYAIYGYTIEELIYGHVLCDDVLRVGKGKTLAEDVLEKIVDKDVLLFGTHWEEKTVKVLSQRARSTTVVIYSERDFNRYYPMPGHCKHLHIETLLSKTHYKIHFWIKPLLAHISSKGTEEDEQFYKGLIRIGKINGINEIESLIPALVRGYIVFDEEDVR